MILLHLFPGEGILLSQSSGYWERLSIVRRHLVSGRTPYRSEECDLNLTLLPGEYWSTGLAFRLWLPCDIPVTTYLLLSHFCLSFFITSFLSFFCFHCDHSLLICSRFFVLPLFPSFVSRPLRVTNSSRRCLSFLFLTPHHRHHHRHDASYCGTLPFWTIVEKVRPLFGSMLEATRWIVST